MSATFDSPRAERAEPRAATVPMVAVEHLRKTFRIPHRRFSTLKERALHPLSGRTFDELRAVDDVSFDVAQGEFFGIVGRNGSGKSTLLKCLAGIYKTDAGHAIVRGRLSPFIELGVGFNPELTARDNVTINAIMLGLTRREARRRFDEIIAFGELEDFLDLKLKNYSSGMSVRLAFSVAIQVDADVLLVDEVLAVGDVAFQQKCFDEFHRLKAAGKTIVFVTHDMGAVERFCDRGLLLERGQIVSIDTPHRIARAYNELNFGRLVTSKQGADAPRYGAQDAAEIRDAWVECATGERAAAIAHGDPLVLCLEAVFRQPVVNPWFSFHVRNASRHVVFAANSATRVHDSGTFRPGQRVLVRFAVDAWFAPGKYELTPAVTRPGGTDVLDLREDLASVMLHGGPRLGGAVDLPYEVSMDRE